MKYNKKKHEELIADYRSEANFKSVLDFQLDSQKYLEDQKKYNFYAKIIERDVVKPFFKQNEDNMVPFKKARVRNGILAGVFVLADLLTFTLAAVLKSPLPSWSISMIGGGFAGLAAYHAFYAGNNSTVIRNLKNKNEKISTEWEVLKNTPEYVKSFMDLNGVAIKNSDESDVGAIAIKTGANIISPLNDEWLF